MAAGRPRRSRECSKIPSAYKERVVYPAPRLVDDNILSSKEGRWGISFLSTEKASERDYPIWYFRLDPSALPTPHEAIMLSSSSPSGWGSIPCGGAVMFCESVALMLRADKIGP